MRRILFVLVSTFALLAHGPARRRRLAEGKAIAVLDGQVMRQAMMISFEQLFLLFGFASLLAMPLLLLMRKGRDLQTRDAH